MNDSDTMLMGDNGIECSEHEKLAIMNTSEEKLMASNIVTQEEMVVDKNAYTVVKEGKVEVLFPSARDVFYNPVQEFNRDLSVAVIRLLAVQHQRKLRERELKAMRRQTSAENEQQGDSRTEERNPAPNGTTETKTNTDSVQPETEEYVTEAKLSPGVRYETGLRVLEALAASGLRSCRFAREAGGLKEVVANDISAPAVEAMRRNIEHNGVQELVRPNEGDACMLMYSERKTPFDVIDLDPYGSPAIFLDSAVQAVRDGGVLQVTCTDMAILCGNAPETCHAKYGALSVRSKMCHEMALRIALQSIESHANRYGRYIEPLLSVSVDFYIRMFVRIRHGANKVKQSASKLSHVLVCTGCDSWRLVPKCRISRSNKNNLKYHLPVAPENGHKCPHCSFTTHLCGPIWSAPIHDAAFVADLLASLQHDLSTHKRLEGVLSVVAEELPDVPLYYDVGRLASACRLSVPPMVDVRSALLNAGYRISSTHCNAQGIKTDAPADFVWDVMRAWEQLHPAQRSKMAPGAPAAALLARPPAREVTFRRHADANPASRLAGLLRFQQNPTAHWGPKSKAKTSISHTAMTEKQQRNQNKKKRKRAAASGHISPGAESGEISGKRERTAQQEGEAEGEVAQREVEEEVNSAEVKRERTDEGESDTSQQDKGDRRTP